MASSPVKFFSVFLAVSVVGWVVFTFAARLLAWFLSRVLSASVGFRVAGFNCLRDVTIKFDKGSVESVSIGEIKLSFRKSLVKLSFGFISKDPKLQLLINDLEIVTRSSSQNKKTRKSARPRSTGKGKWLVTSSMARLLSVSVTDLIIKVPKGAVDIKELTVDTLKVAGPNHILGVKLHLFPLNVHFGDLGLTTDPMGSCNLHDAFQSDQASVSNSEKCLAPFVCEDLLVTCDFGHEKERGIKIINLELKCGHVIANIDERLFHKKHTILEHNTVSSNTGDAIMDTSAIKQTAKSKSILPALKKQMLTFPDKVCDFDRDYKDIGVARFTTKYFVVRNCMANAKCDTLLSAWNTPPGKINMLRVDAKQGAPKDGNSPLELFQVEIYPLRIYLSEAMYRMMWDYFFPEEDDSQRRQEVWRVSTSTGPRRTRRLSSGVDAVTSSSYSVRENELPGKSGAVVSVSTNVSSWQGLHGDNSQVSKFQSIKANMVCGSHQELRRSSSFERAWDESAAESVASNDVVSLVNSSIFSSKGDANNSVSENPVVGTDMWRSKTKDSKPAKSGRLSHEEKKVGKSNDEKKTRARKSMEFRNIKISQVELLVTYEGSRLAINDLRLLMDTFHKPEFTGTWRRLFSRVKKHIIWGVLKSVTGMQGKKFSNHREILEGAVPENDLNLSDSDVDNHGRPDQLTASWLKRPGDGAGDGFVTSIRGLFNTQRRKAKAFVIRTMRGDGHNDEYHDEWSESDGEYPFARQLTITKAKKLIRRKFRPRGQKNSGLSLQDSLPSSPRETTPYQSDSSRSSYEDFHEQL